MCALFSLPPYNPSDYSLTQYNLCELEITLLVIFQILVLVTRMCLCVDVHLSVGATGILLDLSYTQAESCSFQWSYTSGVLSLRSTVSTSHDTYQFLKLL